MSKKAPKNPEPGKSPVNLFFEKNHYMILAGILLFALLLRALALISLKGSVYFDFLLYDERLYHLWAKTLADGTFESSSVYEMAPLPAYFMALVYKLFSPDVVYIRIVHIIFSVLSCFLIYLIGRELADDRRVGLLAALIAAVYKPFIFYSIVPLKTSMSVFLFALMCYLLVSLLGKTSIIKALFLGITCSLINNVRPNAIVLIPFFLLLVPWGLYKGKSSFKIIVFILAAYIGGLAAAQSPFIIRNYFKAGEAAPTTSQSGFHLYMSNNFEYRRGIPFVTTSPAERGVQFTIEASRRVGKVLSSREASEYWKQKTLEEIYKNPSGMIWRYLRKTLLLFNWFEKGDHYNIGFISDYVKFFKIPFIGIWLVIPFGMAGMALYGFKSRKRIALGSVFFVYGATLILFFTNIRMRIPLLVILIPFASLGILSLYSYIQTQQFKKVRSYLVVLFVFFIIVFIPVADYRDMTAFLNTHAIILQSKGFEEKAVQYWEKSSKLEKRYSAFANLSLAGNYMRKGDFQKAINYIHKIQDDSFAAALKYDLLGDFMASRGKFDQAVTAYEKALEINSGLRPSRMKLVKVLWRIDKQRSLEEADRLEYINSFYNLYGRKRKKQDSAS
ncbi:glycosyltransferase family 39 protein [Thermodesulfobacteriota bacterium]